MIQINEFIFDGLHAFDYDVTYESDYDVTYESNFLEKLFTRMKFLVNQL